MCRNITWYKFACEIHARHGHLNFGGSVDVKLLNLLLKGGGRNHLIPTFMRLPSCRYWAMDLAMVSKKNQEYYRKGYKRTGVRLLWYFPVS